jgi:hypothetical protein
VEKVSMRTRGWTLYSAPAAFGRQRTGISMAPIREHAEGRSRGRHRPLCDRAASGLIAACFATAALKGTPVGVAGAVLMTLGFAIKARLEERFLREQLGPDAYDSYRRRVPMLFPFAAKSS